MDLVILKQKMDEYFTHVKAEYSSDIVKNNDVDVLNFSTHIALNEINKRIIHMNVLVYSRGVTQITFNFGKCEVNDELLVDILNYNIKAFAFKPVVEYDELRFYNQCFFNDPDCLMFNLTEALAMFLASRNLEELKKFAKYLR